MRPLLFASLVVASGLVVGIFVPRGEASATTPGDGCLVIQSGFGNVSMVLTRGVVFGRLQSGTVVAEDTVPTDGPPPKVIGAETTKVLADGKVRYKGDYLRFRSTGAAKIKITDAVYLDLSVVGKGIAYVSAGTFSGALDNKYSADAPSFCEDNFLPMPEKPVKLTISSPTS